MRLESLLQTAACLLLAGAIPASALSFGLGPKLGANFSGAAIDGGTDEERMTGLAVGGMAEFGVTRPFSLVLEPMYLQRGSEFEAGGIAAEGEFGYFEIPLLAKAKFGSLSTAHAYLFLGPSMGIKTSAEGSWGGFSGDFDDETSDIVFSGDIGGGAAFRLRPFVYLSADLRYSHGFSDAFEDPIGSLDSWHHRDIRLTAGLLIHLTE